MADESESLPEDLQRCRRLVAVMRGQVLAPSRKRQVLQQLVVTVSKNHEQQQQIKWWANQGMLSPRSRYLRDIQVRHIKTVQKRWRRHLFQKRIVGKLRLEQKWRSRQGITRFRKGALTIQRVFRGHFVRKHKIDIATYLSGLVSKLERLRSDREAYHVKCEHVQQELQQVRLDIDVMHDKIAEEEKAVAFITTNAATAAHSAEAHAESIGYYKSEVTELEQLARHLETELTELHEQDPAVHAAATIIQALCRGVRCRMERGRERQRQRQISNRMLQSKELCYDRIHSAWVIRNEQLWTASAKTIAGLYHIHQAKVERLHLRQDRAARRILRLYRDVQARTNAKQSLQWKKVKRQAKDMASRKRRALLQLSWSGWLRCVQKEAKRRELITQRELDGLKKWRDEKASTFLSAYRKRIATRELLEREVLNELNARVLQHIRTAVQTSEDTSIESAREISSSFFLLLRNDIWTWQVPDKKLHFLSQRYALRLDSLPLKRIHRWLAEAPVFVDLFAPLPTQTLLVLKLLSPYFTLHSRVVLQIQRVREVYEAHVLMREYLALMYTANIVRLSPSTTYSSQQRQRAVAILQEKNRVECLPISKGTVEASDGDEVVERDAFTSFYCMWNHRLCKRCLAMRIESSHQCKCCGLHQYEANTVATDLRLESSELSLGKTRALSPGRLPHPTRTLWASRTERCDFMVLNAFLHALAPVNHANRRVYSIDVLWKLAMRDGYEAVAELYNRLPNGSLNDLLNAPREELDAWANDCCPPDVAAQLRLFIAVLKDEWTQLDAQLAFETRAAETLCTQQERPSLREGEGHNLMTRPARKRTKNKRSIQPNERLEPLGTKAKTTR